MAPLDPTIASPAILKLDDPMDQMGKALNNAMLMDKMGESANKRRKSAAYNAMMGKHVKSDGSVDWEGFGYDLAQNGMGEYIPDLLKDRLERDKLSGEVGKLGAETTAKKADGIKTQVETQAKHHENYQSLLNGVTTLDQLAPRLAQAYKNPLAYEVYGGEAQAKAAFDNDATEAQAAWAKGPTVFAQWVNNKVVGKDARKQHFQLVEEQGKQTLAAVPEYAPAGAPPKATVAGTYGAKPHAPGVTVNLPGEKIVSEFDKAVGKGRGEHLVQLEQAAMSAPQMIGEIDRALGVLGSGKVILGAGSPMMLDLVRGAKAIGFNVDDDKLVNTEELSRFFAQNTLSNIARFKQMGVSLTPMSDSDRKLVEMASAQGTNDPATIKRLLMIQRRMAQDSINQYNLMAQRYSSNPATAPGQTALSTTPVPIPPNPVPPGAPAVPSQPRPLSPAGQDYVKKNPGRAAAIKYLQEHPDTAAAFDEKFKLAPGTAARLLGGGGGTKGAAPFPR